MLGAIVVLVLLSLYAGFVTAMTILDRESSDTSPFDVDGADQAAWAAVGRINHLTDVAMASLRDEILRKDRP